MGYEHITVDNFASDYLDAVKKKIQELYEEYGFDNVRVWPQRVPNCCYEYYMIYAIREKKINEKEENVS